MLDEYQARLKHYRQFKFSYKTRFYVDQIPRISKSISALIREFERGRFSQNAYQMNARSRIEECLRLTVTSLMFDEFELICWINYVEQINLLDLSFDVNDSE